MMQRGPSKQPFAALANLGDGRESALRTNRMDGDWIGVGKSVLYCLHLAMGWHRWRR